MKTDAVRMEIDAGVCRLTLNRPSNGNALDAELGDAVCEAVAAVASRDDLRCLLLTGSGAAFSVGGDIKHSLSQLDTLPEGIDQSLATLHPMVMSLATLPVPVVTALNGPVGGGGIGLALTADLVVAAESVKLRGGYTGIGLTPDLGTSWFLKRRIGAARTKRVLFLNEPLPAQTCYDWGLLDAVYPDSAFDTEVTALVEQIAGGAVEAMATVKALIDGPDRDSLQRQLDDERRLMIEASRRAEAREGITAFLEKRAPSFRTV